MQGPAGSTLKLSLVAINFGDSSNSSDLRVSLTLFVYSTSDITRYLSYSSFASTLKQWGFTSTSKFLSASGVFGTDGYGYVTMGVFSEDGNYIKAVGSKVGDYSG